MMDWTILRSHRCRRLPYFWARLLRQAKRLARQDADPTIRRLKHRQLAAYLITRIASDQLGT